MNDDARGLTPRCLEYIYLWLLTKGVQFSAKCSFAEVYLEQVFDLIGPGQNLLVQEHPSGTFVKGLVVEIVLDLPAAMAVLVSGCRKRQGKYLMLYFNLPLCPYANMLLFY